jgi:phage shock protein PspC (stress-responsive transcriptional regulator)
MMALVASVGILIVGVLGSSIPGSLIEFLLPALQIVGFGALGYGFYKTLKLVFRKRELNFPALNVYRKTKPKPKTRPAAATASNTTNSTSTTAASRDEVARLRAEARAKREQERTYRRRRRHYEQKKSLRRSRVNRVFSGVAGGIAEYSGVSAALVRFAFIAGLFMSSGMFIFVYLLLSIVLPTYYDGENDVDDGREIRIR